MPHELRAVVCGTSGTDTGYVQKREEGGEGKKLICVVLSEGHEVGGGNKSFCYFA